MIKLGIIGFSNNNGHPYSFSAIINGYNKKYFKRVGYKSILDYLKKQPKKNFLDKKMRISKAWSKDYSQTRTLAKACKISKIVKHYQELDDNEIKGIIIAKDDWLNNKKIAKYFLARGIPVFIDKPLTLKKDDLIFYKKYYDMKLLMSCSGLRFSNQVLDIQKKIKLKGKPHLIIGNISNDVEKYSVHLLEVIQKLGYLKIINIKKLDTKFETYFIKLDHNIDLLLNCCGKNIKVSELNFFFKNDYFKINFNDNFNSFKNTLEAFYDLISKKKQHVKFSDTKLVISSILAILKA